MKGSDIKETMEQIHIPEEMQEQIIANIQNQWKQNPGNQKQWGQSQWNHNYRDQKQGNQERRNQNQRNVKKHRVRDWKRKAAVAATFVLAAGLISIPVKAVVENIVRARMESIPEEEVRNIGEMLQGQDAQADSFSREYSERERERMKELRQAYKKGTFPEKSILQVDYEDEAVEGTLCYIRETGLFWLPERELTDEEILEIIDFGFTMVYAIEQSPAGQEVYQEEQEEQKRLKEQVQTAGGISEAEAVKTALNRLKSEYGVSAEENEELHVSLKDISEAGYTHKSDTAYAIWFYHLEDNTTYFCAVDSADGSILETWKLEP